MKRTTKYVAFDVHQATTVASVRDDSGRVLARSVLETHGPSIVEFLRRLRALPRPRWSLIGLGRVRGPRRSVLRRSGGRDDGPLGPHPVNHRIAVAGRTAPSGFSYHPCPRSEAEAAGRVQGQPQRRRRAAGRGRAAAPQMRPSWGHCGTVGCMRPNGRIWSCRAGDPSWGRYRCALRDTIATPRVPPKQAGRWHHDRRDGGGAAWVEVPQSPARPAPLSLGVPETNVVGWVRCSDLVG